MTSSTWRRRSSGTGTGAGASSTSGGWHPAPRSAWTRCAPSASSARRSRPHYGSRRPPPSRRAAGQGRCQPAPPWSCSPTASSCGHRRYRRSGTWRGSSRRAKGARAIPAGAYNVAAQLLAVETGLDGNPPRARVHLGDDLWLTLHAARIPHEQEKAEPDIAVTIELASPPDRLDLFARCFALSPRESQLVRQLATGTDTRRTAHLLALSESTVQDHLKAVCTKTAVHSRAELLARALGA